MNKPRIYLDSCCFIDIAKEAVGNLPMERNNDVWFFKKILEAHKAGDLVVLTSILSVAECLATEKGQLTVPQVTQDRYRLLLTSGQYVQLVNPTPVTTRLVQKFRWEHQLVLGSVDAFHFAAALEANCDEFVTTDDRLKNQKVAAALPILTGLGMRLISAPSTAHLPDKYRQGSTLNA